MIEKGVTREHGFLENFLAKKRSDMANRLIPKAYRNGRILDIGCGNYPYFLDNTIFAEKFGVDQILHDKTAVDWLAAKKINFQKFDIESDNLIPFANEHFDVVTMLAVIEHIRPQTLPRLIGEIRRVLKPGGFFIMTTPAPWSDILLKIIDKMRLISRIDFKEHKKAYSTKEILSILYKGGFQEEKVKIGYFEIFVNIWTKAER